jgi:predicted DNA-binding transcriptional regulator AlpA
MAWEADILILERDLLQGYEARLRYELEKRGFSALSNIPAAATSAPIEPPRVAARAAPPKRRTSPAPKYVPDDPLLSAAEAAAERGQALSTFWRDVRLGRTPAAYYVSPRRPRWRKSEIRAGVENTGTLSEGNN